MPAPLIGITGSRDKSASGLPVVSLTEAYVNAVIAAGGLPVIIPVNTPPDAYAGLFDRLDGILFSGGGDIDIARFNGQPHPRVYEVDLDRDNLEINLVQMAAKNSKPFMGICRGIQVINVALGGTLYTDIGDQFPGAQRHDWYPNIPRDHRPHTVNVLPGTRLAEIIGAGDTPVNSLHHQGLQTIAPVLRPTAYAPDGLLEGVELPGHPFGLGVQWHPEWLQSMETMRTLFRAFVQAAAA